MNLMNKDNAYIILLLIMEYFYCQISGVFICNNFTLFFLCMAFQCTWEKKLFETSFCFLKQEEKAKRMGPGGLDPAEVFESLPKVSLNVWGHEVSGTVKITSALVK